MLVTSCNKCIFLEGSECTAGLSIEYDNIHSCFSRKGFCNIKRQSNWANNLQSDTLIAALLEECKVSIINTIESDSKTFLVKMIEQSEKLFEFDHRIKDICFCCISHSPKYYKFLVESISKCKFPWSLKIINKDDQEINNTDLLHAAVDNIKTNWFYNISEPDERHQEFLYQAIESVLIKHPPNQYYFVGIGPNQSLFTNKFAFKELSGNVTKPFIDKVKSLDINNEFVYEYSTSSNNSQL